MNLRLSVALLPSEDDEVLAEQGARVFLEPEARGVQKLGSRSESRLGTDIDSFGLP